MKIIKNVAVFGLTLVLALVLLDSYLQFAGIQTPMETRIDPVLGPTYIPNKPITRFNEGFFVGAVNAFGYMGPAIPPRRCPGERRVLLMGDSFVLGHTVLPRHYFGRSLEKALGEATGSDVRALNFGKADFNLENMFQYYQDFAGKFDHDIALFFVGEGDLLPTGQVASNLYPSVRLEGDRIVIDNGFRSSGTYRFYKAIEPVFTRSAVLRLVFNTYKVILGGSWRLVVLDKLAGFNSADAEEPPLRDPDAREDLPALSRAVLLEISKNPRNILVIQTALGPELADEIRTIGIPTIDLGSYLGGLRSKGLDPYYWPVTKMRGHWNHAAQPLIGRFLADQILSSGRWPR